MSTPLTFDTFLDRLIDMKHKDVEIPPENRQQMKVEMQTALNRLISVKMLEQLSPDELTEFQKLENQGATDDQLQQYIADHVGPKIKKRDVFFAEILGEFRDAYLETQ